MNSEFPWNAISIIPHPPSHVEEAGILYEADFRDILPSVPPNSIDLIVTDPPYGIDYRGYKKRKGRHQTGRDQNLVANDSRFEALSMLESLSRNAARLLKPGGCLCCCAPMGGRHSSLFGQWIRIVDEYLTPKETVVWDKKNIGLGGHYRKSYEVVLVARKSGGPCKWNGGRATSNVYRHPRACSRPGVHPTPKPEALMGHFIELHSDQGDIVLDPFTGHGTSLVAARRLKRRFLGIELVPEYCAATATRLAESSA